MVSLLFALVAVQLVLDAPPASTLIGLVLRLYPLQDRHLLSVLLASHGSLRMHAGLLG